MLEHTHAHTSSEKRDIKRVQEKRRKTSREYKRKGEKHQESTREEEKNIKRVQESTREKKKTARENKPGTILLEMKREQSNLI